MIKCHLMADILRFLIKNNSHFTLQLPDLFNKSNHIFNYHIQIKIPQILFCLGEGHNYEFHNVENQKEHQKIWRPSLHRKSLFS